jgi:tRNA (guanine37-N1)-methyltransferase
MTEPLPLRFDVITLFPEMFSPLDLAITGRARQHGLIDLHYWNLRDYTTDPHRRVDDRPYGGGPGMVMQVQPLAATIKAAQQATTPPAGRVIYLSATGKPLDQQKAIALSQEKKLILLCGRYEGIDQRIIDTLVDEELSIGDVVLTGGELAAMVVIDAITRLLPGALGDERSAIEDSFMDGLLDHPHYSRPESWEGLQVPDVLLKGDHEAIRRYRAKQALALTWRRRPDLFAKKCLNQEQQNLLNEFRDGYDDDPTYMEIRDL